MTSGLKDYVTVEDALKNLSQESKVRIYLEITDKTMDKVIRELDAEGHMTEDIKRNRDEHFNNINELLKAYSEDEKIELIANVHMNQIEEVIRG
jgi:hypothetical protein